jgi:hypothetical protein
MGGQFVSWGRIFELKLYCTSWRRAFSVAWPMLMMFCVMDESDWFVVRRIEIVERGRNVCEREYIEVLVQGMAGKRNLVECKNVSPCGGTLCSYIFHF